MSYVVKQYFWDLSHRDPEIKGIETTIMGYNKDDVGDDNKKHTHIAGWFLLENVGISLSFVGALSHFILIQSTLQIYIPFSGF